jgi:hypothetical protein
MKKSIFVLSALAMFAFVSCKKDYTCECTNVPSLGTVNLTFEDAKKKDAEEACTEAQTTYNVASPNVSCALK